MVNLEEKISLAKNLIENSESYPDKLRCCSKLYPFTTENLKEELKPFDLQGKDILTVMGSGDQVFEHFLKGAKNIDVFDLNPLTESYYYLKLAALIEHLPKQEFFQFLSSRNLQIPNQINKQVLNYDTYHRIHPFLKGDSQKFWDFLFNTYKRSEIRRPDRLFTSDEPEYQHLERMLNYIEEEQYQKLQDGISNLSINFLNFSIQELPYHLTKKYDFINLSNIIRYVDDIWKENPLEEFKKITDKLISYLKKDGILIIGYLYEYKRESYLSIYQPDQREKYYPRTIYDYYSFTGVTDIKYGHDNRFEDAVIVYKKEKK